MPDPHHLSQTRTFVRLGRAVMLCLWLGMTAVAHGQLTETDRDVDRLLQMLGVKETQAEAIERFREMGDAATPRLIERFTSPHQADRVLALMALQHAWSDQAIEPVKRMLNDRDAVVREAALRLLDQKLDDDQVVATFEPLLQSRDNRLRGLTLQALEQRSPDADRMFQAARDRHLVQFVTPFLPRYYEPRLRQVVLPLLHQRPPMQRHAIAAITHLRDDSPATLRRVTLLLRNQRADIRELAAEYLFHLGGEAELTPLREALDRERDDHAKASIALAIRAIERRRDMFAEQGDANLWQSIDTADAAEAYEAALALLRASPTQQARREAIRVLTEAEPFEPLFIFRGGNNRDMPDERAAARYALENLVAGYEMQGVTWLAHQRLRERGVIDDVELPVARDFVPPMMDYFDPERDNYGRHMHSAGHAFAGQVHVGDDLAWDQPGATVVATAAGVVRLVNIGFASWGGLVIIEHEDEQGERFCSLYGHLGAVIPVRAGDVVEAGEKIGTLGRSRTRCGGGYDAHLHFAIYEDHWGGGDNVTGYIPVERFERGEHKWTDPQAFLRQRMK